MREIRARPSAKCLENGSRGTRTSSTFPELARATRIGRRRAGALLRLLRPGQPRPAARRPDRRGREHAAGRRASEEVLLPLDRLPAQRSRSRRSRRIYQQTIEESYPHVRELAVRGSENPNLMPADSHLGAAALGGRLGRDHDRQEPRDDALRSARVPHQGQPEVRLGEEGAADDVLPLRLRSRSGSTASTIYVDVVLSPDPNVFTTRTHSPA